MDKGSTSSPAPSPPPLWFLPSFYGDIRLEAEDKRTRVIVEKATSMETVALCKLWEMAVKKKWASSEKDAVPPYHGSGNFPLAAPIDKVAKALSRLMKPGRKLLTVVKFRDGRMEEMTAAPTKDKESKAQGLPGSPYRQPAEPTTPALSAPAPPPDKAVTVAAPQRGCPAPDMARAELKARVVLEHFLSPEQMEDFRHHNRFITTGGTTGHRYMVTSRHARDQLAQYQRTFYDLDEQRALCVHDWSVPAAEEMLALHLIAQVPGREAYLRDIEMHDGDRGWVEMLQADALLG